MYDNLMYVSKNNHDKFNISTSAINIVYLPTQQVLITKLRSANTLETEQYRKATKALLVLIPLLGITYLLVLWGPNDESWFAHAFDYTRALMLSTQVTFENLIFKLNLFFYSSILKILNIIHLFISRGYRL